MGTFAKFVKEVEIEGTPFKKIVYNIYDNGACQCFGNCDCYKRKGELLWEDERFKHPLSDKSFPTLEACKDSYKAKSSVNTL